MMKYKAGFSAVLTLIVCISMSIIGVAAQGSINITKNDKGDDVVYSIDLAPGSGIQATDYIFSYRGEALTFANIERGNLGESENSILTQNHVQEEQKIYCSYASLNNSENGGTILKIHFKKNNSSTTEPVLGVDIVDQFNSENNEIPERVVTGDPTVAIVNAGKSINDADSGAVQTDQSAETALSAQAAPSVQNGNTNTEASENKIIQNTQSSTKEGSQKTVTSKWVILFVIVVVVGVMAAIGIKVYRKNKNKGGEN